MNRICPTILAAVALSGCGGPNYTLSGRAGLAPGDTLRLCSPYENDSVLATTVIRRDSSFRIRGHVSEPTIANLMHNDRRIGAPIQLEAADIRLEPTGDVRGFQFTGTPLNDAFNAMNAAQVSLGNVLQALENEPDTPERRRKLDSLGRIYRQIPGDALEANRDNLLGAFLYARRTDADPAKARERLAQFPAQLQNHPVLASVRRRPLVARRTRPLGAARLLGHVVRSLLPGNPLPERSLCRIQRTRICDLRGVDRPRCGTLAAVSRRKRPAVDERAVLRLRQAKPCRSNVRHPLHSVEFPDLARRRDRRPQPSRSGQDRSLQAVLNNSAAL